jgi:hypothetical protein
MANRVHHEHDRNIKHLGIAGHRIGVEMESEAVNLDSDTDMDGEDQPGFAVSDAHDPASSIAMPSMAAQKKQRWWTISATTEEESLLMRCMRLGLGRGVDALIAGHGTLSRPHIISVKASTFWSPDMSASCRCPTDHNSGSSLEMVAGWLVMRNRTMAGERCAWRVGRSRREQEWANCRRCSACGWMIAAAHRCGGRCVAEALCWGRCMFFPGFRQEECPRRGRSIISLQPQLARTFRAASPRKCERGERFSSAGTRCPSAGTAKKR